MRTRVKFCGCIEPRDGALAAECGADAIGLIFAASARQISVQAAAAIAAELPPFVTPVGVFVDPSEDDIRRVQEAVPKMVIQLHGNEPPAFAGALRSAGTIKTIQVPHDASDPEALCADAKRYAGMTLLFDTSVRGNSGGTGVAFDWRAIAPIARERRIIVSGGLTPENVSECVRAVRPFGVDVRSGIESGGRKDAVKMRAFIEAVREADAA